MIWIYQGLIILNIFCNGWKDHWQKQKLKKPKRFFFFFEKKLDHGGVS